MRALASGVPRVFRDHRSRDARVYREYCTALVERSGWKARRLPADVRAALRDAGALMLEAERLAFDLETARRRRRLRDARRTRRELAVVRGQRLALERHIFAMLTTRPAASLAAALAQDAPHDER